MIMKKVIQRNLPLDVEYTLVGKNYIPILDGGGCVCQDCGRLISHIAIVKANKRSYNVGFDCLEKLLANNFMICNFNLDTLKYYKKQLSTIIRFSKQLLETVNDNKHINGIAFEKPTYASEWFTFYYLSDKNKPYNDSKKLKDVDYTTLHKIISNILSNHGIEVYYDYKSKL